MSLLTYSHQAYSTKRRPTCRKLCFKHKQHGCSCIRQQQHKELVDLNHLFSREDPICKDSAGCQHCSQLRQNSAEFSTQQVAFEVTPQKCPPRKVRLNWNAVLAPTLPKEAVLLSHRALPCLPLIPSAHHFHYMMCSSAALIVMVLREN